MVFVYWVMTILQSLLLLIQSQIHQPVVNFQHRLRKMAGPLLSMGKSLLNINARFMSSNVIKLHIEIQGKYQSMQKEDLPKDIS